MTILQKLVIAMALVAMSHFGWANEGNGCLDFHVIENSPIGFIDTNGEPAGVHWEYLVAIEQASGVCINKKLLPYARIWEQLKIGVHDGGIVFKSDSRSSIVEYAALIRTVKTVVVPVKGLGIKRYEDLFGLTIGKTRGTHLNDHFDNDPNFNIVELTNYEQATRMINANRIDAIAGSALVLTYQLKKHDVLTRVDMDNSIVLGEKEQWLQLSNKSIHLDKVAQLNEAITLLKHNGTLDKIMDKYYGTQWRKMK